MRDAPILSFQWLPPDERDELTHALIITEAETLQPGRGRAASGVVPDFVSVVVETPDAKRFLEEIEDALGKAANAQILYLSAHGLDGRVLFGANGLASISYRELGQALARGLAAHASITAVFGMCEAGGADEQVLLDSLPSAITRAYAFTGKPVASDVAALLAGILIDDMRLYEQLHQRNQDVFGAGVHVDDLPAATATLVDAFDEILELHQEEAEYYVAGGTGRFVRVFQRDPETMRWGLEGSLSVPGRVTVDGSGSVVRRSELTS